jgi:hypothetical protein
MKSTKSVLFIYKLASNKPVFKKTALQQTIMQVV